MAFTEHLFFLLSARILSFSSDLHAGRYLSYSDGYRDESDTGIRRCTPSGAGNLNPCLGFVLQYQSLLRKKGFEREILKKCINLDTFRLSKFLFLPVSDRSLYCEILTLKFRNVMFTTY
jgi:hypothetical protein